MQIDDDALKEFMRLYEQEFKEALTVQEAREMASLVLELYRALARPLPSHREQGRG